MDTVHQNNDSQRRDSDEPRHQHANSYQHCYPNTIANKLGHQQSNSNEHSH